MFTTNTYRKGEFSHSEKLCTLKEYVQMGRLKPGSKLLLGEIRKDIDDREVSTNTRSIWIGDATIHHMPCKNDAHVGWPEDHPLMQKFVLVINDYE